MSQNHMETSLCTYLLFIHEQPWDVFTLCHKDARYLVEPFLHQHFDFISLDMYSAVRCPWPALLVPAIVLLLSTPAHRLVECRWFFWTMTNWYTSVHFLWFSPVKTIKALCFFYCRSKSIRCASTLCAAVSPLIFSHKSLLSISCEIRRIWDAKGTMIVCCLYFDVWVRRYLYHNFMTEQECDVSVPDSRLLDPQSYNANFLETVFTWFMKSANFKMLALIRALMCMNIRKPVRSIQTSQVVLWAHITAWDATWVPDDVRVCGWMFWVYAPDSACYRDCFKDRASINGGGQRDWGGGQFVNVQPWQWNDNISSCSNTRVRCLGLEWITPCNRQVHQVYFHAPITSPLLAFWRRLCRLTSIRQLMYHGDCTQFWNMILILDVQLWSKCSWTMGWRRINPGAFGVRRVEGIRVLLQ